jgi:hypothetical protein
MATFKIDKSLTKVSIGLSNDVTHEVSPEPTSLTEVLRLALIDQPGEAGALGITWKVRESAGRQAAQFCRARSVDCVASANGDYHARVYDLPGDRWGVIVWYTRAF